MDRDGLTTGAGRDKAGRDRKRAAISLMLTLGVAPTPGLTALAIVPPYEITAIRG
jgi:hypothetical protein